MAGFESFQIIGANENYFTLSLLRLDGYSRISGKVGVCIGQNGPGVTNFVTAIAAG